MASIDIKYSQSVVDDLHNGDLFARTLGGNIGGMADTVAEAIYDLNNTYLTIDSYSLTESSLRLNYAEGPYQTYNGLRFDQFGAPSGSASATSMAFYEAGLISIAQTGNLNYDYVSSATSLSITPASKGSLTTSLRIETLLAADGPFYPALTGNIAFQIDGSLFLDGNDYLSGTIRKISFSTDKLLLSGLIEGDFQVAANTQAVGLGLTQASVSGTLQKYQETYRDGSHAWFGDLAMPVSSSNPFDLSTLGQAWRFAGNDTISVQLPDKLYEAVNLASGAGSDSISLGGGGGLLHVNAGSGNDTIGIVSGSQLVNGGSGFDQVSVAGARSSYSLQRSGDGYQLTDATGAASMLASVERIHFADAHIALDIDGSGGQAYRLYQAAFNRAPDHGGLGFQMRALDMGISLNQVAQGFIDSPEFARTYGALSNHDFVVQLYANVLHRLPDAGGLKFHVDLLDSGAVTRAMDLVGFSESPENQAALIGVIQNGVQFIPYA